jgi:hypothetical protein
MWNHLEKNEGLAKKSEESLLSLPEYLMNALRLKERTPKHVCHLSIQKIDRLSAVAKKKLESNLKVVYSLRLIF